MVAGPGSTPRARVANATPSSSTYRTTAATVATSNGVVNWGEGERPVLGRKQPQGTWSTSAVAAGSSGTGTACSPRLVA
jgi:hypothetical protein